MDVVSVPMPQALVFDRHQDGWRDVTTGMLAFRGRSAAVLHVGGDVLAVTGASRGLATGGVMLPDVGDLTAFINAISTVRIGEPIALSPWSGVPAGATVGRDLSLRRAPIDPAAIEVAAGLLRHGPAAGGPSATQRHLAGALAHAAHRGHWLQAGDLVRRLLGAGPGATPAGDDVLVGALAAFHLGRLATPPCAPCTDAVAHLSRLVLQDLDRTTTASAHDLRAAAAGHVSDHVHVAISALRDAALVPDAIATASGWGATSGLDTVHGLVASLHACATDADLVLPLTTPARRSA